MSSVTRSFIFSVALVAMASAGTACADGYMGSGDSSVDRGDMGARMDDGSTGLGSSGLGSSGLGSSGLGAAAGSSDISSDSSYRDAASPAGSSLSRGGMAPHGLHASEGTSSAYASNNSVARASHSIAVPERREAAEGHYSRARTLLLEALAEFERARDIARPDLLMNSEEWRSSVVARAKELDKVLNPQPRVVRGGFRAEAVPSLLRHGQEGKEVEHGPLNPAAPDKAATRARLAPPARNVIKAPEQEAPVRSTVVEKTIAKSPVERTVSEPAPAAIKAETKKVETAVSKSEAIDNDAGNVDSEAAVQDDVLSEPSVEIKSAPAAVTVTTQSA
jgi:hypothetical protein